MKFVPKVIVAAAFLGFAGALPPDARSAPDKVVADQQRIADTFYTLGLVPKRVVVSSILRKLSS